MPLNPQIPFMAGQNVPAVSSPTVLMKDVMDLRQQQAQLDNYQFQAEDRKAQSQDRHTAAQAAQMNAQTNAMRAQIEADNKDRDDARVVFDKIAPGLASSLKDAAKDAQTYESYRGLLQTATTLGIRAGYLPNGTAIPEVWSPEVQTSFIQISDALGKAFAPKVGGGPQKMTEMGPDGKTYEFLVGPGGEEGKKYLQPAPKSSVDMTPQPMQVGNRAAFGVYNPATKTLEEVQGGIPPKSASTPDQTAIEEAAQNIVSNPKDITSLRLITTMRGDQRMQIYNAVKRLKPDFDLGMIDRRIQFLNQYENPAGRARINRDSMNNILMHAADLSAVNKKYERADAKLLNLPINALAAQYNPVYTEYMVPLTVLQNEIELYFAGGYAPHEQQKKDWTAIINGEAPPKVIDQFVKSLIHVGLRRADTHNESFKKNMGYDDPNLLTPEAVKAAQELGMGEEVKKFGSGGMLGITEVPEKKQDSGFMATWDDGTPLSFPTAASRDEAVRDSGGRMTVKAGVTPPPPADEAGAQYKTTQFGKFKSVDGGLNWTKVGG